MKKKILALCLVVVLAVTAVTGVTLAYFTDESNVVTNTFTVGDIQIKLDESDESTPNNPDDRTETGNQYEEIYPGQTLTKDPVVTVNAGSENCYVRMHVKVENYNQLETAFPGEEYWAGEVFLLEKLVSGWDNTVWASKSYDAESNTYEFWYTTMVSEPDADLRLPALFTHINIPGDLTNAQVQALQGINIVISADAMQAAGFADADAAWAAWVAPTV